jgi:hypothetical protein
MHDAPAEKPLDFWTLVQPVVEEVWSRGSGVRKSRTEKVGIVVPSKGTPKDNCGRRSSYRRTRRDCGIEGCVRMVSHFPPKGFKSGRRRVGDRGGFGWDSECRLLGRRRVVSEFPRSGFTLDDGVSVWSGLRTASERKGALGRKTLGLLDLSSRRYRRFRLGRRAWDRGFLQRGPQWTTAVGVPGGVRKEPDSFPAAGRNRCGSFCGFLGCLRGSSRNAVAAPQEATKRATITRSHKNANEKSRRKSFTYNGL